VAGVTVGVVFLITTLSVMNGIQADIQKKIEGQEITAAPEQPQGKIIDLMEALKASLGASSGAKAAKPADDAEEEAPAKKKASRKK